MLPLVINKLICTYVYIHPVYLFHHPTSIHLLLCIHLLKLYYGSIHLFYASIHPYYALIYPYNMGKSMHNMGASIHPYYVSIHIYSIAGDCQRQ